MRIGELAQRSGVSVRSLRYYEQQGLLASERSPRGQRHFVEEDVERVLFLQRLYGAGLSSRTILELLPCVDSPSLENSRAAVERMAQEREKLSSHITDLINTRDALDAAMARALQAGRAQEQRTRVAVTIDETSLPGQVGSACGPP
ncbi:MerR family transcriptional regulator [Streptantibioticus ferralitis]|uniref:MerR family transcriptional regulator n=1 Tax=Streptantibioticus ferralitis TaxID=236510 RepID=A0ABT5Z8U4_9ACTN|nr:MerR family transcriptional regulator [Streptantibioticus ferralitis]MDF2260057.1 MerR family transcriptional regulator [Streptantibioticus ferralitis]